MTIPILVTGGTGTLGRLVVPRLRDAGRNLRVLSRTGCDSADGIEYVTGDLATGEGVEAALDGADTVLHLAGSAKGDEQKARNLVEAAKAAGVKHLVYISVVGTDRVPIVGRVDRAAFGYYGEKGAAERLIAESGLPWTTVRATQLHEFILLTVQQMEKLPVVPTLSGVKFQPIDAGEVADRLVELTLGEPAGLVSDIGGPRTYEMRHLVRSYLSAKHKRRLLLPLRVPGRAAQAMREGANLSPDHAVGKRTWEDFLAGTAELG